MDEFYSVRDTQLMITVTETTNSDSKASTAGKRRALHEKNHRPRRLRAAPAGIKSKDRGGEQDGSSGRRPCRGERQR
jgi:hypothetical protein